MPKQSKTKAKTKSQLKAKRTPQPESPGITTKKSYWVILTVVMAVTVFVAGFMVQLALEQIIFLTLSVVPLIGLIGYVRVTSSTLSWSKRATFLFVGASVIGFSIWAAIVIALSFAGLIATIFADQFFLFPSLVICLTVGAFIGEMLGQIPRVQRFFFKPEAP